MSRSLSDAATGHAYGVQAARITAPLAELRSRRRLRRWQRVVLVILAATTGVVVAGIVVVVAIVHHLNTPQAVPASWRAPTVLPASAAAMPIGNLVFDSNRNGNFEIWTMNAAGGDERQLTNNKAYDSWWAQLSPNRRTIIFYRTPKGVHDRDYSKTSLWVMAANGTDLVELRPAGLNGWVYQGHAEWSPDGRRLVMFGGSRLSPQIWTTTALGADPVEVTHRGGSNVDPAWAPNGSSIAFVGCPGSLCLPRSQEIYVVAASGGTATRITSDSLQDDDPAFSPNGRELAWLTKVSGSSLGIGTWNIRLISIETKGKTISLPHGAVPSVLVKDNNTAIDSKPAWSLNGTTIYFHRAIGNKGGFQIWAIEPNGSDLRELTKNQPGSNEYPQT